MIRKTISAWHVHLFALAGGLLLTGTTAAQHRSQHVAVTRSMNSGGGQSMTMTPTVVRFQRVNSNSPFFFVPFGNNFARGLSPRPIASSHSFAGSFPVSFGASPGYSIVASSSHPNGTRSSRGVAPVAHESSPATDLSRTVALKFLMPTPDADLWVEGKKVDSIGRVRRFTSPPLEPGVKFAYTARARWVQDGREMTQVKEIPVSAGDKNSVDFTAPAAASDGPRSEGNPKR